MNETNDFSMTEQAINGKLKAIRCFASVLLLSLYVIVTYHVALGDVHLIKLMQQIVRFGLTLVLMYLILQGKKWPRILISILFIIAALMAIVLIFLHPDDWIIYAVMATTYSYAIFILNFSKDVQVFFNEISAKE